MMFQMVAPVNEPSSPSIMPHHPFYTYYDERSKGFLRV
jgi:hypothetical protein